MGPGRETDVFESGRRRRIAAKCALAVLTVALTAAISTIGEAQPAVVVAPGNAAVTGFSGALPPIQIPPGVDPATRTFIDQNGPSLRVIDLQNMGGPPNAQLVGAAKPFTAPAAVIGQVFGVALDDSSPPNIYAAASSAYGLPIVAPGPDGQIQHIKVGAAGASYMAGVWGPHGGPGSIWKIDGRTGAVALFANVRLDGRANSGPALGGLAYDVETKSLFVADRETGFIHRFAFDGRELGRYDHGVAGRAAQGLPPVPWQKGRGINVTSAQFDSTNPATWNYAPPERRVFGLGLNQRRLYYAVADGLQIWSVGIGPDGSLGSDAQIELAVPAANGPTEISKITFDEQGRMFLAERPASTGAFDLEAVATPCHRPCSALCGERHDRGRPPNLASDAGRICHWLSRRMAQRQWRRRHRLQLRSCGQAVAGIVRRLHLGYRRGFARRRRRDFGCAPCQKRPAACGRSAGQRHLARQAGQRAAARELLYRIHRRVRG